MKKIILLSLLGVFLTSCKQEAVKKNDTIVDSKKIEDSIQRAKEEQEVLNLNIDDNKTFKEVNKKDSLSEKERKLEERNDAIYSLPTLK